MSESLKLADRAGKIGEIPVGAVIIDKNNNLLATASNAREISQDATAHAEMIAIRQACKLLQNWRLDGCTLYVTLEPCPMCAGAIIQARLKTLVYGVDDFKTGSIRTIINLPDSYLSNHSLEVIAGVKEKECRELLQLWFRAKRNAK